MVFLIPQAGIKTNPKKGEAIGNFPQPRTLKELLSFPGLSGYYRRFIRDYAKLAKPLTSLLRGEEGYISKRQSSKVLVEFDERAKKAFTKIKKFLVSNDLLLSYPNDMI